MAHDIDPEGILDFWLNDVGPAGWYRRDADLDDRIRETYLEAWERAARGDTWLGWTPTPRSTLALLVLLDQFPRNMFRGDRRSYATDRIALSRSKCALEKGWDLRVDGPGRQFFDMPLMHSECLADQERAVRLFAERLPDQDDNLVHAKAHRDVIRKFGRFPTRNGDLQRATTAAEQAFLSAGGYGKVVESLRVAS